MEGVLARSFYERSAVDVARALLGKIIVHRGASGRIVETEAYLGIGDEAAHSARGITPRTRVIFGSPGHAYVYLIYGMYYCLNLVTEPAGVAGCVLIRALEPISGVPAMRRRRGVEKIENLANGPGKLTEALGVGLHHNGADVTRGPITVREGENGRLAIGASPRIGISKAADLPLRFFVRDSPFVSLRNGRLH